jgi:predicted NUDIX family phosphoesterase
MCPIKQKLDPTFNVWTAGSTLIELLEAQDCDAHVVLLDRGLFDALCWMDWFSKSGKLLSADHLAIDRFLVAAPWRRLIDLVFVMTVDPAEALAREFGGDPTRQGRIMNDKTLQHFNDSISTVRSQHPTDFLYVDCDTTHRGESSTLAKIAAEAIEGFESFKKSVLVVPRAAVDALLPPGGGFVSDAGAVSEFLQAVRDHGAFVDRRIAEKSADYIQPIPMGYLRHDHRLLMIPQHYRDPSHWLHTRHALWAGGHVQMVDAGDDHPIANGLRRELEEEFPQARLPVPALVGLVVEGKRARIPLHVGVVHRLDIDDTPTATALVQGGDEGSGFARGSLLGIQELMTCFDCLEGWSQLMLTYHLQARRKSLPVKAG